MSTWLVFLLCFVAVATGWLLARLPLADYWLRLRNRGWHQHYMRGIQLLMREQSDQAIEHFIQQWPVNPDNVDLHNALANMLRKKGEVERAVRIHTHVLECNRLSQVQIRQATIELAHDYIAAGLLDRAERLLINVVNNTSNYDERALELLQRVYQTEKEWRKAITVAEQLLPKRSLTFSDTQRVSARQAIDIAHYYCEIADQALQEHNYHEAERALNQALAVNPACARATITQARLALKKGQLQQARDWLARVPEQDSRLLSECVSLLRAAWADQPEQALQQQLLQLLENYPSAALELALYEQMAGSDREQALAFLRQRVSKRPTLQGLNRLIREQQAGQDDDETLVLLQRLSHDILSHKPVYQCRECGFAGQQMHWLCPQCKRWDTIRRIRGSEGD